jgi:hypothetical protein
MLVLNVGLARISGLGGHFRLIWKGQPIIPNCLGIRVSRMPKLSMGNAWVMGSDSDLQMGDDERFADKFA